MSADDQPAAAPEFWREVEEAFNGVLDAGETARMTALQAARPAVRAEVEALLAAHAGAGAFIAPVTVAVAPRPAAEAGPDPRIGSRIGPFDLKERIAEGGFGAVYRAERAAGDFTQEVAVKLIAARIYDADTLRRFRAERQILARLQHPSIVSLLDGGVTADGHPYIAMEYVRGAAITEHCRRQELSFAARLRLFRAVCTAVSFAHRHLVVHRDLKPANVLVTQDGAVKVLDFGVAKLLDPRQPAGDATGLLLAPLTPDYASPEQLQGGEVTTACDVYALGVMLYEVVTGHKPYVTAGRRIDEIVTLVLHREPVRPSAVAAGAVPYEPRLLRGDVDAIVLQAMAKDPERRYASAEELGEDLARHLDGLPVTAREPSIRYLAGKALVRHKLVFTVAGVLLALLVAALAGAISQARIAARERERAERRFDDTRRLAHALTFKIQHAIWDLPGSVRARRLIVDEARAYLHELSLDPAAGDDLRVELALSHNELATVEGYPGVPNLGDQEGAIVTYERGVALLRSILERPAAPPAALHAAALISANLSHTLAALPARRTEAEPAARRSLAFAERLAAVEPGTERTLAALAEANTMLAYAVTSSAAGRYWQAALRQHEDLLSRSPADRGRMVMVAIMNTNLAEHFDAQLDPAAARPHHRAGKLLYEKLLADAGGERQGDDVRATFLANAGVAGIALGDDLDAAIRLLEQSLALRLHVAKTDPANADAWPRAAQGHVEMARACEARGDRGLARFHAREAVALYARHPPEPQLVGSLADTDLRLARLARQDGASAESCAALERATRGFLESDAIGRVTPRRRAQWAEIAALRQACPGG